MTGRALGLLVATLGAIFLVLGYGFDQAWMLAPTRGVAMQAPTAFSFVLLGLAIAMIQTFRTQAAYVAACSLAFASLLSMAWISLTAMNIAPAYGTQIAIGLVAASVIVRTLRIGRVCGIVMALGLIAAAIGAVGLVGHAIGLAWMYWEHSRSGGMASNTAAMLVMLGVATAWSKP